MQHRNLTRAAKQPKVAKPSFSKDVERSEEPEPDSDSQPLLIHFSPTTGQPGVNVNRSNILNLQHTLGNQAVRRMLQTRIQASGSPFVSPESSTLPNKAVIQRDITLTTDQEEVSKDKTDTEEVVSDKTDKEEIGTVKIVTEDSETKPKHGGTPKNEKKEYRQVKNKAFKKEEFLDRFLSNPRFSKTLLERYKQEFVVEMYDKKLDGYTFKDFGTAAEKLIFAVIKNAKEENKVEESKKEVVEKAKSEVTSVEISGDVLDSEKSSSSPKEETEVGDRFLHVEQRINNKFQAKEIEKLFKARSIVTAGTLNNYLKIGDKYGDLFWFKVAKKLKEIVRETDADKIAIEKAIEKVTSSEFGPKEDDKKIRLPRRKTEEIVKYREIYTPLLPNIAKYKGGDGVIEKLATGATNKELQDLYDEIFTTLVLIDPMWDKLKPASQKKTLGMVVDVTEVGGAKGAVGELKAIHYIMGGKASKPFTMGKEKLKYPGQDESTIKDKKDQDVDMSSTRKIGMSGEEERVYTEAKYDMRTFLHTYRIKKEKTPDQLINYNLVRDRKKPGNLLKKSVPKPKRVEVFVSQSHDWLFLFMPAQEKVLNMLLDNNWSIVIDSVEVKPSLAKVLAEETKKFLRPIFSSTKQYTTWALENSVKYPIPDYLPALTTDKIPLPPGKPREELEKKEKKEKIIPVKPEQKVIPKDTVLIGTADELIEQLELKRAQSGTFKNNLKKFENKAGTEEAVFEIVIDKVVHSKWKILDMKGQQGEKVYIKTYKIIRLPD